MHCFQFELEFRNADFYEERNAEGKASEQERKPSPGFDLATTMKKGANAFTTALSLLH